MILTEFLAQDNIRLDVVASSKKRVLELVGKYAADYLNQQGYCDIPHTSDEHAICPLECFGSLFKREKLGSTAINNGVALPHAKLPENHLLKLDKPMALLLRLEQAVDYEANDNKPVDLIYAVLFPAQCCESYRGVLPKMAEALSDKGLIKRLRQAETSEDIWHILSMSEHEDVESTVE